MRGLARLGEESWRAVRRAGWAGALGAILLAVALVGGAFGRAALDARRYALDAERIGLARSDRAAVAARAGSSPTERISDFYARFPALRELPRTLTRLHAHGDRHGLSFERADYRSSEEAGTPLLRVSLNLPVRGEFGQIYGWLSELLGDMPEVALEALSVRRGDSEVGLVDAEVRLAVFVRREP